MCNKKKKEHGAQPNAKEHSNSPEERVCEKKKKNGTQNPSFMLPSFSFSPLISAFIFSILFTVFVGGGNTTYHTLLFF